MGRTRAAALGGVLCGCLLSASIVLAQAERFEDARAAAQAGKYAEAAAMFEKLAGDNPFDGRLWRNLAFSLGELKEYDRAVEEFEGPDFEGLLADVRRED